jgi:predicted ATPase
VCATTAAVAVVADIRGLGDFSDRTKMNDYELQLRLEALEAAVANLEEFRRALNPPIDELAAQHAANIAQQIEEAKQDQAQPLPEVYAERKRNAALRRRALLDLQYAEAAEVLKHQITRCEAQGDFTQAKLLRVQLTNLRADLERRFPA